MGWLREWVGLPSVEPSLSRCSASLLLGPPVSLVRFFRDFLTVSEMDRLGEPYLLSFAMIIKIKCH